MKRTLGLILLLASVTLADRQVAEFRLKKDATSPMRGWIVDFDDEGFRFERFGGGGRMSIRWADLLKKDASQLRQQFRLEMTEEERLGLIDGHEMYFKGGGSVRGLLIDSDDDGAQRMKVEGLELPYPKDRIERIEKVRIKEEEAFSPEEVYRRRFPAVPRTYGIFHLSKLGKPQRLNLVTKVCSATNCFSQQMFITKITLISFGGLQRRTFFLNQFHWLLTWTISCRPEMRLPWPITLLQFRSVPLRLPKETLRI